MIIPFTSKCTKKDVPLIVYTGGTPMPEHHTKQGYARICASVPCKLMVFHEIWRFPVFPSLEDTVIYLQLLFRNILFRCCSLHGSGGFTV